MVVQEGIDLEKVSALARDYSFLELLAALIWQRRFRNFNGEEIVTDLAAHPDLWKGFWFAKPMFFKDDDGLSFLGVVETLMMMTFPRQAVAADTLYLIAEERETTVSQLQELGRKWNADRVEVYDSSYGQEEEQDCPWPEQLSRNLLLMGLKAAGDAVVLVYQWEQVSFGRSRSRP